MQDLQEIFVRLQTLKKQQKDIRDMYKDVLAQTPGYKELVDELKVLREKKKTLETRARETVSSEMTKLEDLKIDMESDSQLLSDIALSKMVKGETVEVTDEQDQKYEPVFAVRFKKAA